MNGGQTVHYTVHESRQTMTLTLSNLKLKIPRVWLIRSWPFFVFVPLVRVKSHLLNERNRVFRNKSTDRCIFHIHVKHATNWNRLNGINNRGEGLPKINVCSTLISFAHQNCMLTCLGVTYGTRTRTKQSRPDQLKEKEKQNSVFC